MYRVVQLDEIPITKDFLTNHNWPSTLTKHTTSYHPFKNYLYQKIGISLIKGLEDKCPVCYCCVIKADIQKRRCLSCHNYLLLPGESIKYIAQIRKDHGVYVYDIDSTVPMVAIKPIFFIWNKFIYKTAQRPGDRLTLKD